MLINGWDYQEPLPPHNIPQLDKNVREKVQKWFDGDSANCPLSGRVGMSAKNLSRLYFCERCCSQIFIDLNIDKKCPCGQYEESPVRAVVARVLAAQKKFKPYADALAIIAEPEGGHDDD